MKPPTAGPDEPLMRFFTPELFERFNSPDNSVADLANEEWEASLSSYRRHLDGLQDRFTPEIKELAALNLHDAELIGLDEPHGRPTLPDPHWPKWWNSVGIVSVRQSSVITTLFYVLWDHIHQAPAPSWSFSKLRPHWLYDELDVAAAEQGQFVHRILLSDGRTIAVPFTSVLIHRLALPPAEGLGVRQSA